MVRRRTGKVVFPFHRFDSVWRCNPKVNAIQDILIKKKIKHELILIQAVHLFNHFFIILICLFFSVKYFYKFFINEEKIMIIKILSGTIFMVSICVFAQEEKILKEPVTVPCVNLQKYIGVWYEIAKYLIASRSNA